MCLTKIYHPNIDLEGHVCLNILRDDWKPVLDINAVIYGIIYLLYEPNPNDPLNHGARADGVGWGGGQCSRLEPAARHRALPALRLWETARVASRRAAASPACNPPPPAEAAALFRDNRDAFVRNVNSSLRGGRIGTATFPKLL